MDKKVIISMSIGIFILLVLVTGATYAYFTVGTSGSANSTLTASTSQVGTVSISSGSNLTLNPTLEMMMNKDKSITYYATPDGSVGTTATNYSIATAKVTGPGTYNCDYTINIKGTGTLYQAVLNINNGQKNVALIMAYDGSNETTYSFNTPNLAIFTDNGLNYSGKMTGLTSTVSKSIKARFWISNYPAADQSSLANKSVVINFKITDFTCVAV